MPGICGVQGCINGGGGPRPAKCRLHMVPSKEPMRSLWLNRINRPNAASGTEIRVCGLHFRPEDYGMNLAIAEASGIVLSKARLKVGAIPSMNLTSGCHLTPLEEQQVCIHFETATPRIQMAVITALQTSQANSTSSSTEADQVRMENPVMNSSPVATSHSNTEAHKDTAESTVMNGLQAYAPRSNTDEDAVKRQAINGFQASTVNGTVNEIWPNIKSPVMNEHTLPHNAHCTKCTCTCSRPTTDRGTQYSHPKESQGTQT